MGEGEQKEVERDLGDRDGSCRIWCAATVKMDFWLTLIIHSVIRFVWITYYST